MSQFITFNELKFDRHHTGRGEAANRFHQDMKGMASAIDYLGDREAERSELEARA